MSSLLVAASVVGRRFRLGTSRHSRLLSALPWRPANCDRHDAHAHDSSPCSIGALEAKRVRASIAPIAHHQLGVLLARAALGAELACGATPLAAGDWQQRRADASHIELNHCRRIDAVPMKRLGAAGAAHTVRRRRATKAAQRRIELARFDKIVRSATRILRVRARFAEHVR
jgi:hypothetical protein